MTWSEVPLGSIAEFRNGLNYTKANEGQGLLVINVKDFKDRLYPQYSDLGELNPAGLVRQQALLADGDILFVRSNGNRELVGRSLYITSPPNNLSFSAFCIRARIKNPQNSKFFAYFVRSRLFRQKLAALGRGTNISNLNQEVLSALKVPCPPPDQQDAIVSIIGAYDELIENNRRRIALLEQAARELYREWFVRLRFPGHEHVKVADGVPEGWSLAKVGDAAPLSYGKALQAERRTPGPYLVFGSSGEVGTHSEAIVSGPGIIVGRKGSIGSVHWSDGDFWPIDTVYFVQPDRVSPFLQYALERVGFINTDVAVPGLNRDYAHSRELLWPTDALLRDFHEAIAPMRKQCSVLRSQNEKLARGRDLLLPRLMNGSIAV